MNNATTIETSIGRLTYTMNSEDTVSIRHTDNALTVNRIDYTFWLTYKRERDSTTWRMVDGHIRRADWSAATDNARRKIYDAAKSAWDAFTVSAGWAAFLRNCQRTVATNKLEAVQSELEETRKLLAQLEASAQTAVENLARFA